MFQSTVASSADGLKRPTDRGRADCSSLTGGGKAKNFTGFALLSTELFPLKGWRFQNIRKFLMKCPGPGRIAASLFRLRLAARICFRNSRSRPPVPTEQGARRGVRKGHTERRCPPRRRAGRPTRRPVLPTAQGFYQARRMRR